MLSNKQVTASPPPPPIMASPQLIVSDIPG